MPRNARPAAAAAAAIAALTVSALLLRVTLAAAAPGKSKTHAVDISAGSFIYYLKVHSYLGRPTRCPEIILPTYLLSFF